MKLSRAVSACRSHNTYRPSIALWQHFILPNRPASAQQRFTSSTSPAVHDGTASVEDASALLSESQAATPAVHQDTNLRILRVPVDDWVPRHVVDNRSAVEELRDHEGVVVAPMSVKQYKKILAERFLPWYLPATEPATGLDRLALEISRFHAYVRPSRGEALARRQLIDQVRSLTAKVLPDHELEVFGSERTGLALATSDIDLRLMDPKDTKSVQSILPPSNKQRYELINKLVRLHRKFSAGKDFILCTIRHARYPLLSMQHSQAGIDIQIVLSNDTSLSRSMIAKYLQEYPYLRELFSVVKTMFDVRGLSDVFRGGFGSYSIFMMIVASLRHSPPEREDAAGALENFLAFWSSFDTTTWGVSIEPTEFFNKDSDPVMSSKVKKKLEERGEEKPLPSFMLCLRDPADPTNDLGRKGACIKHVQATCKDLHSRLKGIKRGGPAPVKHTMLSPIVGRVYDMNKEQRKNLESYGKIVIAKLRGMLASKANAIRKGEQEALEKRPTVEGESKPKPTYLEHGDTVASLLSMPSASELAEHEAQEMQNNTANDASGAGNSVQVRRQPSRKHRREHTG